MKNKETLQELMHQLKQTSSREDFVINESAILHTNQEEAMVQSNIVIKILIAIGGVLSTLLLLAFLLSTGIYDSELSMLITGIFFMIGSVLLHRSKQQIYIETLGFTTYLAGLSLFIFGLGQYVDTNAEIIALMVIIISILSMIWVQKYIHVFLSVLIINGSLYTLFASKNAYELLHITNAFITIGITYALLNEAKLLTKYRKWAHFHNPIIAGLIVSFLGGLLIISNRNYFAVNPQLIWISSIAILIVLFFVLQKIVQLLNVTSRSKQILTFVLSYLALLPTAFFPAISGAVLILLLSFLVNRKAFFGISVAVLIYSVSQFYYDLKITLLIKSILMMITGALFLILYFFTQKKNNTL